MLARFQFSMRCERISAECATSRSGCAYFSTPGIPNVLPCDHRRFTAIHQNKFGCILLHSRDPKCAPLRPQAVYSYPSKQIWMHTSPLQGSQMCSPATTGGLQLSIKTNLDAYFSTPGIPNVLPCDHRRFTAIHQNKFGCILLHSRDPKCAPLRPQAVYSYPSKQIWMHTSPLQGSQMCSPTAASASLQSCMMHRLHHASSIHLCPLKVVYTPTANGLRQMQCSTAVAGAPQTHAWDSSKPRRSARQMRRKRIALTASCAHLGACGNGQLVIVHHKLLVVSRLAANYLLLLHTTQHRRQKHTTAAAHQHRSGRRHFGAPWRQSPWLRPHRSSSVAASAPAVCL